ncbi:MAG: methyl-accepting chemotaxis protein [Thiotrichales bacterium]
MFQKLTVLQRITAGFTTIVVLLALTLVTAFFFHFNQTTLKTEQELLSSVSDAIRYEISNRTELAAAIATSIADTPSIRRAFIRGDRNALNAQTADIFQTLKRDYGVKQFQFHTPDAHSFFRVHKPVKYGDDLSSFRHTVVEANQTGKTIQGIEIGVAGLGLRGVVPIKEGSRVFGTVEIGMALDETYFETLKSTHHIDLALYVPKGDSFERTQSTTVDEYTDNTALQLALAEEPQLKIHETADQSIWSFSSAVRDYSGKPIAVLEVIKDNSEILAAQKNVLTQVLLIGGIAVLLASAIAYLIALGISRPLGAEPRELATVARAVADGNLNLRPVAGRRGAVGVYRDLQDMSNQLRKLVESVKSSASQVEDEASSLAGSAEDLNKRTKQQAIALLQTSTSMQELMTTVKATAGNAQEAADLSDKVDSQAKTGEHAVYDIVKAMAEINDSSNRATEIIGTIDEIAFQTNLLALNAAVEAARAGDKGRGFAVVANEVRSLAQRSAAAAQEIKTLIEDSVNKVNVGSGLVDNAGTTLNEIVASIGELSSVVDTIAGENRTQTENLEQISFALQSIESSTEANTSLASSTAKSAGFLGEEAKTLSSKMDYFQLDQQASGSSVATDEKNQNARAAFTQDQQFAWNT